MKKPIAMQIELAPPSRMSLTEKVAGQLAELIIGNRLGPGDRLPPERELSERLQVSRIVVRESLKSLAERGLVRVRPGVGTFVVRMAESAVSDQLSLYIRRNRIGIQQLLELRSALEPAIAESASRNASSADLDALADNLARTEALVDDAAQREQIVEEFAWVDLEFHQLLARASGNPLYQIVLDPLIDRQLEVRRKGARLPGAARRAYEGHRAIYEWIRKGDAGSAALAMRAHLTTVASLLYSAGVGGIANSTERATREYSEEE